MRFLLDQSAEARIATYLAGRGHDATRIARDYPSGLPDEQVLAIAHRERRILVANDKDFGELVFRRNLPPAGVVVFPLEATTRDRIDALERPLVTHRTRLDRFLVVTPAGVRVRS